MLESQNVVFSNIKTVLNPNITEPITSCAKQMKLKARNSDKSNHQWIACELALLGTRTKFGQFVVMLQYVCQFTNDMMTPISVLPQVISKN